MNNLIKVTYTLKIINEKGRVFKEKFSNEFDTQCYSDKEMSADSEAISFKMKELRELYGSDIILLNFTVDRG
ncbi:hypothetical protein RVS70_05510 [Virgibacillus sp. M23]|uniref:hypothetical protein n=1 Tax=Virgibacillus sp. M23 TaxID=3079030 RepID=UPI002A916627|nr:hypothetical protein [Virgibacillus sp. M23]MDY7043659.1 hypothetical protein [Virgibacillus sp. M23]